MPVVACWCDEHTLSTIQSSHSLFLTGCHVWTFLPEFPSGAWQSDNSKIITHKRTSTVPQHRQHSLWPIGRLCSPCTEASLWWHKAFFWTTIRKGCSRPSKRGRQLHRFATQPSNSSTPSGHANSRPSHNEPGPSHARGGVLCGPPHGGGWQPGKLGELTSWLSRQPGGLLLLRPRCNTSLLAAVLPATTPTECHGPHGTVAQADGCLR